VSAKFEGFPPEDQKDIDDGVGWLNTDIDDVDNDEVVVSGATMGAELEAALNTCIALFTASIVVPLLIVAV
jgi:hypothetical protein